MVRYLTMIGKTVRPEVSKGTSARTELAGEAAQLILRQALRFVRLITLKKGRFDTFHTLMTQ